VHENVVATTTHSVSDFTRLTLSNANCEAAHSRLVSAITARAALRIAAGIAARQCRHRRGA
jgi:hypothetical protein